MTGGDKPILNACAKSVVATKVRDDGRPYAGVFGCDCREFVPANTPLTSRICASCGHYRANHYHRSGSPRVMPATLAQAHANQFADKMGAPRPYQKPE
jgi:hypothetical protein